MANKQEESNREEAQPRTMDGAEDLGLHVLVIGCHHDISINRMTETNILPPLPCYHMEEAGQG